MKYNPEIHHRKSIRLRGYDYTQPGAYFITLCTQNRACLFGEIMRGQMVLNDAGRVVANEWVKSAAIRDEIELDEYVVMPNHFHGIVLIVAKTRWGDRPAAPTVTPTVAPTMPIAPTTDVHHKPGPIPKSIGAMVAGFKSAATKRINQMNNTPGAKIWQRNYYEHIVRDENELNRIREYIFNNPAKWEMDRDNPDFSVTSDRPVAPTGKPAKGRNIFRPNEES